MIAELTTLKKNSNYYSDIPANFSKSLISNDLAASYDIRAVQESIAAIIMTKKGERPFNPEYGCDITDSLFENMSNITAYSIKNDINSALGKYEPRIQVKNIQVTPDPDNNRYGVSVEYHLVTDYYTLFTTTLKLRKSNV